MLCECFKLLMLLFQNLSTRHTIKSAFDMERTKHKNTKKQCRFHQLLHQKWNSKPSAEQHRKLPRTNNFSVNVFNRLHMYWCCYIFCLRKLEFPGCCIFLLYSTSDYWFWGFSANRLRNFKTQCGNFKKWIYTNGSVLCLFSFWTYFSSNGV